MASPRQDFAHIPIALEGPLLTMTFNDPHIGDCITIFVGIVDETYTDAEWTTHRNRLATLFGITDPSCCIEIQIGNLGDRRIDAGKLLAQTIAATNLINQCKPKVLRIVGLGVGTSEIITDALEHLIRKWDIPLEDKHVQFISLGESRNFHNLNFTRRLCMKQICKTLQYYNTMDYNSFGRLRTDRDDVANHQLQIGSGIQSPSGIQTPSAMSTSSFWTTS